MSGSLQLFQEEHYFHLPLRFYGDIVTINLDRWYPLTYAFLLSIKDVVYARFSSLVYSRLADQAGKYPGLSLYTETLDLFECGDQDLDKMGQDAYAIMKSFPMLAINSVIRRLDHFVPDSLNDGPVRDLIQSLPCASECVRKFSILPYPHGQVGAKALLLSGLSKCFGHPYINMVSTVKVGIDKMHADVPFDPAAVKTIRNVFVQLFCGRFYKYWQNAPVPSL